MREETPKKANINEEKHQKKQKLMSKNPQKKCQQSKNKLTCQQKQKGS